MTGNMTAVDRQIDTRGKSGVCQVQHGLSNLLRLTNTIEQGQ